MSTWFSKPNQSLISKVTKKRVGFNLKIFLFALLKTVQNRAERNPGRIGRLFNCNEQVFFYMAGGAQAKMSTWFSKPNQSLISKVTKWSIPILNSVLFNTIPTVYTPISYVIGVGIFLFSGSTIFLFHFLIVVALLYYRKKTKQLRARTVSVRVTCTLAIATGVFIVCWVPISTLLSAGKPPPLPQRSPLYFWFETLALSNSAMNFVIYSARIGDFKDAYVGIFRKMFCL